MTRKRHARTEIRTDHSPIAAGCRRWMLVALLPLLAAALYDRTLVFNWIGNT